MECGSKVSATKRCGSKLYLVPYLLGFLVYYRGVRNYILES